MIEIGDVFVIDVKDSDTISHRDTKHCVCVSVAKDKYLVINTEHREMYDDFGITVSNYPFLKIDRFVACSALHKFSPDKIISGRQGKLKYTDMIRVIDKIQNSKTIDKTERDEILPELIEWQMDNS